MDDPLADLSADERKALAEIAKARANGEMSRRDMLKGLGIFGAGAAVGGGGMAATGTAQAQTVGDTGTVGASDDPWDGWFEDIDVSSSITDPAGVEHTGELADASDVGSTTTAKLDEYTTIGDDPQNTIDALGASFSQPSWGPQSFDTVGGWDYGANAYASATVAQTGEVILPPFAADRWGVYDPESRVFSHGDTHNANDADYWMGASSIPDGRIIAAPHAADNVGIYDPFTHTYTQGPVVTSDTTNLNAFVGALLAPNGIVYFVPRGAPHIGKFDPSTDSYLEGPTHGKGTNVYQGATIDQYGHIVFAPSGISNVDILEPSTDTLTTGPSHSETGTRIFVGAVLTPTGDIILVPYDSDFVGIVSPDPTPGNYTYTRGPAHNQGDGAFVGGALSPTGEVIMIPEQASNFGIVDPEGTVSYRDGPAHNQGADAYRGSALCNDGTVFCPPHSAPGGILNTNSTLDDPERLIQHPVIQGGI